MDSSNLALSIETLLEPIAQPCIPKYSNNKAVVHQWIHALHSGADLFAQQSIGTSRAELTTLLVRAGFMNESRRFKKKVCDTFRLRPIRKKALKFIDLFAGIGGMRLGFEAEGGICVFSSEFEKNAQSTYFDNHGELPFGDITTISEKDIPDHDVLIAGFPCQPFSHAGLKLGIEDTRGTLFYDIARILKEKKPSFALLENVKGIVSHNKGHTLQTILRVLTDIGYECVIKKEIIDQSDAIELQKAASKMVLKAKDFGVPQNRQRIYIVLWRKDLNYKFEYPVPLKVKTRVGDILEQTPSPKYTISDKLWEGHQRRKARNKTSGKGFGYGLVTPESEYTNTISARYYKDGSEILIAQVNSNPRKLTTREASRLQGFPEQFVINPSDVQAYKQFGNSVSVPVIKSIAKNIMSEFSWS
jgi:DNA (cytosine-5)-methyltransferase 1